MKIEGIAGPGTQCCPAPAVLDTSSSAASGAGDAQNAYPPASAAAPASPPQQGGWLAGRLQLDLHFTLAESYSATASRQSSQGYQELRTSVEKRFQADYRFDMSFITGLDATAQKMGSLGSDVLNRFVDAAGKLSSLNENDLRNFIQSADSLFNELSKTAGADGSAFEGAKQLLKSSVSDFIHMAQQAAADGTGAPGQPPQDAALPDAPGALPPAAPGGIDFGKFRDEAVKKFDDAFSEYLQKTMASATRTMLDYQQAFLDALSDKQNGPGAETGGKKEQIEQTNAA